MLIDAADPRYGGAPDPDDERRRRWEPMDRRVFLPFLGSISCFIVGSATEPVVTAGLNVMALGLCYSGVRAAWPQKRRGGGAAADALD